MPAPLGSTSNDNAVNLASLTVPQTPSTRERGPSVGAGPSSAKLPSTTANNAALADLYSQHAVFLSDEFDPNEYAHSILNGTPYNPSSKKQIDGHEEGGKSKDGASERSRIGGGGGLESGDVSAALAKLNFGIEDLNRQLKAEITTHHPSLLIQAAAVNSLDSELKTVRGGVSEVENGVDRLRKKISQPYQTLSQSISLLSRLHRASDLTRRAGRFVRLVRRLEAQMGEADAGQLDQVSVREGRERRERALAEAALTLAEIETLVNDSLIEESLPSRAGRNSLEGTERHHQNGTRDGGDSEEEEERDPEHPTLPIASIEAVAVHFNYVGRAREQVVQNMENMVGQGLETLDQTLLASSLQTAFNLSALPQLVSELIADLTQAVEGRIREAFDVAALARDVTFKEQAAGSTSPATSFGYKSRSRTEPTNFTLPQWTSALWTRLDELVEDMTGCCIKVYTLEKVLKFRKDPLTQISFMDEALKALDDRPSYIFWTTLSATLEAQTKEASRTSSFIQTNLSTNYPRLLRLFHDFFSKIAVHTDTVYTAHQQSPETILILRSLSTFETLYLSRSSNRINEAVASIFSGGSRSPPGANEGISAARTLCNELDTSKFDPLLVKNVARGVAKGVEMFRERVENLVITDYTATSLIGPLSTAAQDLNAEITNASFYFWSTLNRTLADYPQKVRDLVIPAVESIEKLYTSITNPLLLAIRREFSSILFRMHRTDLSKSSMDAAMGGGMGNETSSLYMRELTEKLSIVRQHVLGAFRVGDMSKDWVIDIAGTILNNFVLHASIVRPLGESGKLKLLTDMTNLEFVINQLLGDQKLGLPALGDKFKALRAFRPLLFLDNSELSSPSHTAGVPPLVLLHHIIVRSPETLPLPHKLHGWQEAEYIRWVNEHEEMERVRLVEGVVDSWVAGHPEGEAKDVENEGEAKTNEETRGYVKILKEVLERLNKEHKVGGGPT